MLNANIPTFKAWVKRSFLTDGKEEDTDENLEEAYVFAITSLKGHAIYFCAMLNSGAFYRFLPIHALLTVPQLPEKSYSLEELCLWDAFSNNPIVTIFDYLKFHECYAVLRNKEQVAGEYMFTIDWLPDNAIETGLIYQLDQNKCMHIVELSNGQLAGIPSNRLLFKDSYFISDKPSALTKNYRVTTKSYHAETSNKWSVANVDEMFYKDKNE